MSTVPTPPSAPVAKKSRPWLWFLGGGCLVIILLFAGCTALIGGAAKVTSDTISSASAEADKVHTVEFRFKSNGPAYVVYGPSGSTSTENFNGEWSKTVEVKGRDYYSATGYNQLFDGATEISCTVLVDGVEHESHDASGDHVSVTCSKPIDWGYGK